MVATAFNECDLILCLQCLCQEETAWGKAFFWIFSRNLKKSANRFFSQNSIKLCLSDFLTRLSFELASAWRAHRLRGQPLLQRYWCVFRTKEKGIEEVLAHLSQTRG